MNDYRIQSFKAIIQLEKLFNMVNETSGWFARLDGTCQDREQQIGIWIEAWEKSVIDDVPISTGLPNNWPSLPAGLLSDPGIVLDQLVSRNEAEKDGRSVKGVTIMPAKFADMILADEFKNTNRLKKKEPLATISLDALPPGFRAYAEQMNNEVKKESDISSETYEVSDNETKTGIPIPFADPAVGAGIFPERMFRIHSERCEDLNPNQQKEDTKRLLNGLQLMDSSMMSINITRKRLLIVLIKLGLVSPGIETDCQISRSMAENILEKNVVCDDLLRGEWPWNDEPILLVSKPPWVRIKDKFRNEENGSELRKEMSNELKIISGKDGGLRFSALRGNVNLYRLYVERALQITKKDGKVTMVVPDSLLREKSSIPLRKILVSKNRWESAWSFSDSQKIFPGISQGVLVIGVIVGGRTEVLTSFGPLELSDLSNNGLSSKAPFLELERGPWSTWTDASWAVPKMPRDTYERNLSLKAINDLADQPRLCEEDCWLNQSGKNIRVRVGEIDQSNNFNIINWQLENTGVPLIRSNHFKLDGNKVIIDHPAFDGDYDQESMQTHQSMWVGDVKNNEIPRIACQAVVNSGLKRRLLWSVVPKNCVLGNSVNYLQIPKETCNVLEEEFGSLYEGLNTIVNHLNSESLNTWSKVWAANNNVNNYEIAGLPFPTPKIVSSLSFKGNKRDV